MHTQDIHFFVFDGLSDWEAAYAIAGINNPQYQSQPNRFRVRTVASAMGSVATAGGLRIQPDLMLDSLSETECTMLILPGGSLWDEGKNAEAVDAAKAVLAAGGAVAAICGATAGLARGGLLDDKKHTSNAREYLEATQYKGGALYQDEPAVADGALITASAMAPVDFAYQIFRYLHLYSPEVLSAWHGLFKTGEAQYFAKLMQATKG